VAEPKTGSLIFHRAIPVKASTPVIHLVQALAKGDRDELAVQAAVELGISSVTPWQAENSISNWSGKEKKGQERWRQIVISALKQSQQAFLPGVHELAKTHQLSPRGTGVLLRPDAGVALSDLDTEVGEFTVVVGPEGGISPAEIEALEANGFVSYRLGASVLRTSTAGPAAIAAIQALSGAWSNA
jgi:16S rRNA (uracil1498-N3)-methyltransferase